MLHRKITRFIECISPIEARLELNSYRYLGYIRQVVNYADFLGGHYTSSHGQLYMACFCVGAYFILYKFPIIMVLSMTTNHHPSSSF